MVRTFNIVILALLALGIGGCLETRQNITQSYPGRCVMSKEKAVAIAKSGFAQWVTRRMEVVSDKPKRVISFNEQGVVYEADVQKYDSVDVHRTKGLDPLSGRESTVTTYLTKYHWERQNCRFSFADVIRIELVTHRYSYFEKSYYVYVCIDFREGTKLGERGLEGGLKGSIPYIRVENGWGYTTRDRSADPSTSDEFLSALLVLCPNVK